MVLHQDCIDKVAARTLKIVYTPLHGTGNLPVRRVLKELGFDECLRCAGAGTAGRRFPDRKLSESGSGRGICT